MQDAVRDLRSLELDELSAILVQEFGERRFRAEFKPAFRAWVATKPLTNPNAPLTPFVMPQYRLAAEEEAGRLDAEAEVSSAQVRRNIQRASNYVLAVVLFSVALFFAGTSTKLACESKVTAGSE